MNLRPTQARRATSATLGWRPEPSTASSAASTKARLCSVSSRRAALIGSARSGLIACPQLTAEVGEEACRRLAHEAAETSRHRHVELGAGPAQHDDRIFDAFAIGARELGYERLATGDHAPERGDLFGRGYGGLPRPVFELGERSTEALAVGEQPGQVGPQLGEEARVAPEVGAAKALLAERAGLAVRLYVGGLGANPERDGDLPDRFAGYLGVEEPLDERAGTLALSVDLEPGQHVDGLALALFGDAIINLRACKVGVPHKFGEHLDRRPIIGVALGKTVTERVASDALSVVGLALFPS